MALILPEACQMSYIRPMFVTYSMSFLNKANTTDYEAEYYVSHLAKVHVQQPHKGE